MKISLAYLFNFKANYNFLSKNSYNNYKIIFTKN